MAGEIKGASKTGRTLYAHILDSSGKRWNGTTFETYDSGSYANYDISLTEQGSSGVYIGDFPSDISSGEYEYFVYIQSGASPAEGDSVINTGKITWNGTSVLTVSIGTGMTGSAFRDYVVNVFIRDDKDTEIYEAATDTVSELRRIFPFEEQLEETTVTDTLSVLGDYKLDLETDFGLLVGDVILLDGTNSKPLIKLSKQEFDRLYPNPTASGVSMGRPKHYCIFNNDILIGPVPDSITAYTFKYTQSIEPVLTVTSATASVPFTNLYREMVRAGTLFRLYLGLEAPELSSTYEALYRRLISQAVDREEMNKEPIRNTEYQDM